MARDRDIRLPGWPDRAVGELAARQQTMITRGQLLELGVSVAAIARAVRRGRLHRVHQGVYSIVPAAARPALAAEWAALLACGAGALLSHASAAFAETWSEAERRLLALIRRAGLPLPEANVSLGSYIPDLMWRAERVIVEYDSYEFHSGPRAFVADLDRHNQLVADGWQVIHVTWEQLTRRPEQVLVWIAAALARSPSAPAARRA